MAPTRFYFPQAGGAAAPIAPTYDAAWHYTGTARSRLATSTTKQDTAVASELIPNGNKGVTTDPSNVLGRQYVSLETVPSARTIAGTVSAVFQGIQGSGTDDGYLQLVIRVVAADGTTVRGTLYGGQTGGEPVATVGAQDEELSSAAWTTRIWDTVTLSSVAAQTGDHIVIEVGGRSASSSSGAQILFRTGDAVAVADYALTSGLVTDLCPWVEFSDDVFGSGATTHTAAASLPVTATVTAAAGTSVLAATAALPVTTVTASAATIPGDVDAAAALAVTVSRTATATTDTPLTGTSTTLIVCTGTVSYDPALIEPEDADYDPDQVAPPSRLRRVPDYVIHVTRETV